MSRFSAFAGIVLLTVLAAVGGLAWPWLWWLAVPLAALAALGVWDLLQTQHTILRNYPVIGHLRWAFESVRPEIRQYLIESDRDEVPFSREERALVYQRAKNEEGLRPFGTRHDVYAAGYAWLTHAIAARPHGLGDYRVKIGGDACARPYEASTYNISAMSFGALGAHAIEALNRGAKIGGFAHDTGEGGISRYHRHGGDLIWEIGSGYFGCCDDKGSFDFGRYRAQAQDDQVKMVEIKLSQGAKPGHGGVLPAAKITAEIAEARGVPMDRDCVSPPAHSAFDTPVGLLRFVQQLREGCGGKPVGFKLCIGHRWEFMGIVKAMLETGIKPDFIVVDGKEGGTGAAPLEFVNHMGAPMAEGLTFVRNTLLATGLRDGIRIGAAGKMITGFDLIWASALGADWVNSARGFMFALGCIQAQACHTNRCPTGVTTQDKLRQRALVIPDKAQRVANFHRNTMRALADMVGAAGVDHPTEIQPWHIQVRQKNGEVLPADKAYPLLERDALLDGTCGDADYDHPWRLARADSFAPAGR